MTTRFQIDCLTRITDLQNLCAEWNALAEGMPFRRWEWQEAWFRHYATTGEELFVVTLRDDAQRLVGLAPWYRTKTLRLGQVIRFLGDGEVCSDHLTILTQRGQETDILGALAQWLHSTAADQWDLLELTGVDTCDPNVSTLVAACQALGHRSHTRPGLNCWQLTLPKTVEAVVDNLGRSRRDKGRRLLRKVFGTGKATSKYVTLPEELDRGFEILVDLHQRRWQQSGLPGCFASQRFYRFHREVATRLLAAGALRLHWVELAGRPVSVAYDLLGANGPCCYQMGYDPDFAKESPGWLQVLASLQAAIADGAQVYDLLRGDEPYKAHWGAVPVPTTEYRIVGSGTTARLRHAAWLTEQNLRRWAKQGLRLARGWQTPTESTTVETKVGQ